MWHQVQLEGRVGLAVSLDLTVGNVAGSKVHSPFQKYVGKRASLNVLALGY